MIWLDFNVHQAGKNFTVEGDWKGEVMGWDKDGNPGAKEYTLYQPHDVFVVDEDGWLRHVGKDGDVLTKKHIK